MLQYYQGSLALQLNGVLYYAQTAPTAACASNAKNIDTIKAWENLATAALLSGKQVYIQFTVCSGANYLDLMTLIQ